MLYDKPLIKSSLSLRMAELEDCNETYLSWLKNPKVNQYLETRWEEQNISKITAYVESIRNSAHSYLFAITCEARHIGNIKIGPIHPIYGYADISYFIGDTAYWGRGIASASIELVTTFAFSNLGLNRLQAGVIEGNTASEKVLIKNGYKKEGTFREKFRLRQDSDYINSYSFGLLYKEWQNQK